MQATLFIDLRVNETLLMSEQLARVSGRAGALSGSENHLSSSGEETDVAKSATQTPSLPGLNPAAILPRNVLLGPPCFQPLAFTLLLTAIPAAGAVPGSFAAMTYCVG